MGFTIFGLSDQIMKGVHEAGYATPTPIQSLAIPPALAGKDLIGCAQTGTGKTAAFVLPLLQRLGKNPILVRGRKPRALVLAPTRELALQVRDAAALYGRSLALRVVCLYGGASMDKQLELLRKGVDIVVATPGRLLDHIQRGSVRLDQIEALVLDEADRMLDMGFIHDVRKIIKEIPAERQTMLFSATLSPEIKDLASGILRTPETVDAGGRQNPVETITQHFYAASRESKMDLLLHAIATETMQSILVFSRTKHGADKICRRLERSGIAAAAIHANRSQSQRERALEGFRQGKFRVLVATDIAARGIDVTGISHVINFDIPQYAEDYIHRIGRTGRAGATGDAVTFVTPDDQQYLRRIEQYTGKRFRAIPYPGMPSVQQRSAAPVNSQARSQVAEKKHRREADADRHAHDTRRSNKHEHGRRKKSGTVLARKRKGPARKMESFSSDFSGASWSNY